MLSLDQVRAHLQAKPSAILSQPFGPGVDVYKVGGKMFVILAEDPPPRLTLKCDPVLSEVLRGQYRAITPGYHTDKRHWISIAQDAGLPDAEIERLIDHAYDLVRAKLTRKGRAALEAAEGAACEG
jgi:predicted DNA-binding protein (MmcQ/YjbR family)